MHIITIYSGMNAHMSSRNMIIGYWSTSMYSDTRVSDMHVDTCITDPYIPEQMISDMITGHQSKTIVSNEVRNPYRDISYMCSTCMSATGLTNSLSSIQFYSVCIYNIYPVTTTQIIYVMYCHYNIQAMCYACMHAHSQQ